jgi:hypothetical protein
MGWEKEQQIVTEEQARQRARSEGKVCGACSQPLLTAKERASGICADCLHTIEKED